VELSAEVLHSTVASVPQGGERRKHTRVPLRFKVKIIPYENGALGEPFFIWTRDICPGGIGIIHYKPLKEDRKFIIRLPRQDDTPLLLLCTVRVCKQVAAAVYNIGASFTEVAEPAGNVRELAINHFQPELAMAMKFVPEAAVPVDLTDEVRRISSAILD
jgi:hypothetical protein